MAGAGSATGDVPDVLAPGLACVFCGINPGRVSASAGAHFANPRNDFWRLLHEAGFTPRLFAPNEQLHLLSLGFGITNAARRTTPGSGDLRRRDFDPERLTDLALELRPRAIAFVGKEAYRGLFGERPELGTQERSLDATGLFVLPSTSPANAAVLYAERLRWFAELRAWIDPAERPAVRALIVDARERVLLVRFEQPVTHESWWATPGGGTDGEDDETALRRELGEELGLVEYELGPLVWTRTHSFAWSRRLLCQSERIYLVRVDRHDARPTVDLVAEGVAEVRWWTLDELERADVLFAPRRLVPCLRALLRDGAPMQPIDVGI